MGSRYFIDKPAVREYYQWDGNFSEAQDYLDRSRLSTYGGYVASLDGDNLVVTNSYGSVTVGLNEFLFVILGSTATTLADLSTQTQGQQEVSNQNMLYVTEGEI